MSIRGILYDLGDVLFEAHLWREWNYKELTSMGLFHGNFTEFYKLYEGFLRDVYEGEKSYDKGYTDFLIYLGMKKVQPFKKISYKKKGEYENNRVLYEEVENTLSAISEKKIKNIIITDNEMSETNVRLKVLSRFNINKYIDNIFTSYDMKMNKSNPMTFKHVLDTMNLNMNNVLFVGHDKDEISSANSIGIKTLEYNNYLNVVTYSKYKIKHFSEILNYFDNFT